ncbi:SHOCT domain-containing protein [Rhizobium sp. FY34]|uniref:SHOCT domain-containing protein n=1 Tax=Rhizobium sp. FY34 TaxID=2562309 RepID=UPI0010C04F43|nr:SHOCT domain-containing protein [Rhizobium sp. FY34]
MVKQAHGFWRWPLIICVCASPLALAGCTSFALDDGIPNTAPPAIVVGAKNTPRPEALAKLDTGTYPTFAKQMTAANTQIGDAEATSSQTQLEQLGAARQSGAVSEAEYQSRVAELRRLAGQHAADAEKQIAN